MCPTDDPSTGICKLCQRASRLQQSHVIPKFVIRWLKDTSPTHIRGLADINRRIQDGPTRPWLCEDCEQRLSAWEKPFAEQVFLPIHSASTEIVQPKYGPWALKFATSIAWRALLWVQEGGLERFSPTDLCEADAASRTWREFMLDERPHPGRFEQHILPLDTPEQISGGYFSPHLSRYLLRAVSVDVIGARSYCVVHAKLCRLVMVGFLRVETPRKWKGTKLHVKTGRVGSPEYHIPASLIQYWNDQANKMGQALYGGMSERQRQKVADALQRLPPEQVAGSEVFRALRTDIRFTGSRAFCAPEADPDDGASKDNPCRTRRNE